MNSRQFFKLFIYILISCLILYLVAKENIEIVKSIFLAAIVTPPYVIALNTAVTIYLLKYVDSISSSITPLKSDKNSKNIQRFQLSLRILNQEAISNLILAVLLFVILKVLESTYLKINNETVVMVFLALQISIILLIFVIVIMQTSALRTAMKYRELIENKK